MPSGVGPQPAEHPAPDDQAQQQGRRTEGVDCQKNHAPGRMGGDVDRSRGTERSRCRNRGRGGDLGRVGGEDRQSKRRNQIPEQRQGQQRGDSEKPCHMPSRGGRPGRSQRRRRGPGGGHQQGRAQQQSDQAGDVREREGGRHDPSSRGALSRSADRRSYSSWVSGFDSSKAATAVLIEPSKKVLTKCESAVVRTSAFDEVGE